MSPEEMPGKEARNRIIKSPGGAPRGEPADRKVGVAPRQRDRYKCAARRSAAPHRGGNERSRSGRKTRRGNEGGCLTSLDEQNRDRYGRRMWSGPGSAAHRSQALTLRCARDTRPGFHFGQTNPTACRAEGLRFGRTNPTAENAAIPERSVETCEPGAEPVIGPGFARTISAVPLGRPARSSPASPACRDARRRRRERRRRSHSSPRRSPLWCRLRRRP